jgi:site-specific recombinase XerD
MVVGQQIICDCQEASWFILYIPFDKKGWIDAVRNIHGRKWNTEEKYWQLPYVKESFRALKQHIGMQHLVFNFEINPDIPDSLASPKNKLVRQPKFQLNEFQKKAVVAFEEKMMLENKAWRTRKTYKGLFKRFVAYFPNTKPSQITRKQIEEYIIYRKQDNISDSQLHQLINCFNCFYVRLLEQPEKVVKLERPKKKKKLPNVFSLEEIELLLKVNTNLKHQCMLILIYSGGLRKSELLDLRVEDISFDRKTIFIRNAKGGKDRCTFFSEVAQKYTAEYLKIYQPKHYLFEGQSGGRYSETSLQSIYEKAKKRAQVRKNVTLHGLRHSFATHLVEKGVPLHVVQELLGHSSIKTTEIYLHISNKFRKELRSPLDDLEL